MTDDPVLAPVLTPVFARIAAACARAGLDLAQPLCVGWYNDAVSPDQRLPDLGDPASLAIVIGNTRALWPVFLDALRQDPALARDPDPLDRYTARSVGAAVAGIGPCEVRFSFEPPPRLVAMQRLAHVAGLAYLAPSHLSVHPVHGPWIALRAVVVVDAPGPAGPPPRLAPPCDCQGHCAPHLQRALDGTATLDRHGVRQAWRAWLAVRDACPVGRACRYSDEQIRYHYAKDTTALGPAR